jgi:hypothetical protein
MASELDRLNASLKLDSAAGRGSESSGNSEEENLNRVVAAFSSLVTHGNEWISEAVNLVGNTQASCVRHCALFVKVNFLHQKQAMRIL